MNIRPLPALTTAIALLAAASTASANTCSYTPSPHSSIVSAMDDLMAACPPAMGACLGAIDIDAWPGPVYAVKCYGKKKKGSGAPDADTVFQIGSITKTMTGTLYALRIIDGTVPMFDYLSTYTGWQNTHAITLFELATHHSGLARTTDPIDPTPPTTVSELYDDAHLCVNDTASCYLTPGQFLYSNFGYELLGHAVADADGKSWSEDNHDEIMYPLGMYRTWPHDKLESQYPGFWENRATGYVMGGDGNLVQPSSQYMPGWPVGNPAGGLYSSSNDMLQWLSFNIGLMATSQDLADARDMAQHGWNDGIGPNGEVGFSWNRNPDATLGTTRISKPGTTTGFSSHIAFAEGELRGAFVLTNTVNVDDYQTMTNDLLYSLP